MFSYVWPIALVILCNTVYQICAKSVPADIHPLASVTVTYAVSTAASAALYFVLNRDGSLLREYARLNWAPFVLGFVLMGLEVGFIYVYRAGWQISTASIMQSSFLAVVLLFVGLVLYHETITPNKVIGIVVCLVGLYLINKE